MLLDEYYRADPELRDVWIALPGTERAQILQWDARVTTKGELQKLAEGFAHQLYSAGTLCAVFRPFRRAFLEKRARGAACFVFLWRKAVKSVSILPVLTCGRAIPRL